MAGVASGNSNSFHDLRISSLAAFMAGWIIAMRFFAFKATHPKEIYVEELHASVPNTDGELAGYAPVATTVNA